MSNVNKFCWSFVVVAVIVFSFFWFLALTGCGTAGKYFKAPAQFQDIKDAVAGTPGNGTVLNLSEASDVLRLQKQALANDEKRQNMRFEQELTATVGIPSILTNTGIDGILINDSDRDVQFYIIGPITDEWAAYLIDRRMRFNQAQAFVAQNNFTAKSLVLEAAEKEKISGKEIIKPREFPTALSPGTYVVYFLAGDYELNNPRLFHSDTKQDVYNGDYYNWYVGYRDRHR